MPDGTAPSGSVDDSDAKRLLLRTVVDAAPFGLIGFDTGLYITEWNRRAERNSGLARADVVGRHLLDVFPDFAGTEILRDYERALAGELVEVHERWYGPPGAERCYDATFAPLRDAAGQVVGGAMLALDVTERAQAERAQRDDRAFLRSLIDTSPASIVAFDRELRQTEWNPRAERNTGIRREQALGRTTEELFPGFLGSDWHRLVLRVLDGEVMRGLDFAVADSATGDQRVLDVTMAPLYDASRSVVGALVMSLDVTERVHAQQGLEESEARYRELFEHSAAMQLVVDAASLVIVDANAAAVAFYGFPRDALIGTPMAHICADVERFREGFESRTGTLAGTQHTHILSSGEARDVEVYATLVTRHGKRAIHTVVHDVTARVRAEAALASARAEAERASRAKTSFLADMSHELRTPLGAVIGFAQLLRDGRGGPLTDVQREYLDDVLVAARHIRDVVDDGLDLARIEAGAIEIHPQPVDLAAIVEQSLATVMPIATEREVALAHHVEPAARRVVADAARVRQVLLNYLTNAIKFNRPGGTVRVDVTADHHGAVRLAVRDTGRGIAREDLDRLFVGFQRLDVRDVGGSGLGLAVTRRVVEAMGGRVEVESALGEGSVFYAVLPGARDSALALEAPDRARSE